MTQATRRNESIREENYNSVLEQLLRRNQIPARAERRDRSGIPDVRVDLSRHDQILLECKYQGGRSALEQQLDARLQAHPDALGLVGVIYPERLRYEDNPHTALEQAEDLEWWLHGSRGTPQALRQSHHGSVADLATHLPGLPLEIEGQDRVVQATGAVRFALEQSSKAMARNARIASRIATVIAESDRETNQQAALQIAALIVFNAMAFQDRLSWLKSEVRTVKEALRDGVKGLRSTWEFICENIDYVPVFRIAIQILDILDDASDSLADDAIKPLVQAVEDTRTMEGHDLSGRLFHTLLTDAKFTGAYYTSIPAATMLAQLVFTDWPKGANWADYTWPASLNIADLACGTGTLLMAVAQEAERRHKQAGGVEVARLHKTFVEKALHGYDVQLSAIHFAATSLAMLNPSIEFDGMNLWVMKYEADGEKIHLGSLDFLLDPDSAPAQYVLSPDILPPPNYI